MRFKFLLLSILLIIASFLTKKLISYLYYFEEVKFPTKLNNNKNRALNKKNILLVNSAIGMVGGAEIYTINLYKNLLENGYNANLLIVKNSELEKKLKEQKIPYYAYNKLSIFKVNFQPGLYLAINEICKQKNIQIIHCNIHRETPYAKKVANHFPVKVVMSRHIPDLLKTKYLKNVDGLIAVSSPIKEYLKEKIKNKKLTGKKIKRIPPFFNEKKFTNFKPTNNRKDFFKKHFNVKIKNLPTLCTVAHMHKDITHKNHPILLKAIQKLIHKKNIPVQLMLVGDGERKKQYQEMVKELKIQDYVYFLGQTDKIPEILYHSDIKILPSQREAFGIVLLEAALMKKPIIGSTKTGMIDVIKHDKTGLLFENNNLDSLVEQIEKLLDNPEIQKTLGENAYNHVMQNFSTQVNMKKILKFYEQVTRTTS